MLVSIVLPLLLFILSSAAPSIAVVVQILLIVDGVCPIKSTVALFCIVFGSVEDSRTRESVASSLTLDSDELENPSVHLSLLTQTTRILFEYRIDQ